METQLPKRIAILIPTADSIPGAFIAAFAKVYGGLAKHGWEIALLTSDEPPLDHAREWLLRAALRLEPAPDFILWLDADMLATEKHVLGLLEFLQNSREADCASALYFKKTTFGPVCAKLQTDSHGKAELKMYFPKGNEPEEIDSTGLGCLLIRTSSLKEKLLPKSSQRFFWFDYQGKSEDANFCLLMREAGMRIFLLPELVVPHAGGKVDKWHYEKKRQEN